MSDESLELPSGDVRRPLPSRQRRWPWLVVGVLTLAVVGAGGAYAWFGQDSLIVRLPAHATAVSAMDADDKVVLTDLMAAQQKTSEDLAGLDRALAGQREQLTAIADRLAELSTKMDLLQKVNVTAGTAPPAVAAQPAPATARTAPVVARTVPPVARIASKPKKPVQTIPPGGPISVGGLPLTPRTAPEAQ